MKGSRIVPLESISKNNHVAKSNCNAALKTIDDAFSQKSKIPVFARAKDKLLNLRLNNDIDVILYFALAKRQLRSAPPCP